MVKSGEHLKASVLVKSSEVVTPSELVKSRPRGCRMSASIKLLTHIAAEMKTPRCGMPESIQLYAQIGRGSKTRECPMSEYVKLLTQIDAARGHGPLEDSCLERPKMREFKHPFCHIALGYHNI